MDEPTSAIDPIDERMVYEKFSDLAKGKLAFIVTYRLASARIADRIIVLQNREIKEIGTHDELTSRDSIYAYMFKLQASWYEKPNLDSDWS
jgi:ATP-binding cassette subfamily B protein